MQELIDRLENAAGPDRELDAEIAATIKACPEPYADWIKNWAGEWKAINGLVHLMGEHGSGGNFRPLAYTASFDAALTLVPEGFVVGLRSYADGTWRGSLRDPRKTTDEWILGGERPNPAIALCIASLKAREAGR